MDVTGTYRRKPVENHWHIGTISALDEAKGCMKWSNKAGVEWNLTPDVKLTHLLRTDDVKNPYHKQGHTCFELELRDNEASLTVVGFWFANELYIKDGQTGVLPQKPRNGFHGYISMRTESPPTSPDYGYGVSFYVSVWPLVVKPIQGFQIGLPSTWIIPDNRDFDHPLCPKGTRARDDWPERGPHYRDVFQTIEGGLGYWESTHFHGTNVPKYRMNGTPNGYNHEVSSPGWGFGRSEALSDDQLGIAQLSNRLLIPPDGFTFSEDDFRKMSENASENRVLGNAWMALSNLVPAQAEGVCSATGDLCWTLFLNSRNFNGPVAFWTPETWSRLSHSHKEIAERGLDARRGLMQSGAMEVASVPYFEETSQGGLTYSKIPRLQFPVNDKGETILMQDVTFYQKDAVGQEFDMEKAWKPRLYAIPLKFKQGPDKTPLEGIEDTVQTTILEHDGQQAFGLKWTNQAESGIGTFPEYFRQEDDYRRVAAEAEELPSGVSLHQARFRGAAANDNARYTSTKAGVWANPGPTADIENTTKTLADGSIVRYAWYRFVDQPSMQALSWTTDRLERLQKLVEEMHQSCDVVEMQGPSSGILVALDDAMIVEPPKGLEYGYVPIVLEQTLPER